MKTSQTTMKDLTILNEQLKACPKGKTVVYVELLSIQRNIDDVDVACYWNYLMTKYWEYTWRTSLDICHLEQANKHYDKIFTIATEAGTEVLQNKYFFKSAYCKYMLSQEILDEDQKGSLLLESQTILRNGLKKYPNNGYLSWLQKKLIKL